MDPELAVAGAHTCTTLQLRVVFFLCPSRWRPGACTASSSCVEVTAAQGLYLITLNNNPLFLVTRCTEEVTTLLMQTAANRSEHDGILATRLCTHKDDVEITNERRLQQLSGELLGGSCCFWG